MNATANAQPVDNVKPRLGFTDNGYWTPQTAMLESIREWALGWAVGGGWETAARQLGVHHRTFRPKCSGVRPKCRRTTACLPHWAIRKRMFYFWPVSTGIRKCCTAARAGRSAGCNAAPEKFFARRNPFSTTKNFPAAK